jgi:hypothetical protein
LVVYEKVPIPDIPDDWDFEKADKSFDKMIAGWRRLTGDTLVTLWIFYNKLKRQGARRDLSENSDKLPTWLEWIESKGISDKTPISHFKQLGWLSSDSMVSKMTGNSENYTPPEIIECVRQVMGSIDLDPASCKMAQEVVQADEYYTEEESGLDVPWHGKVFLNPPYGMPLIQQFTDKLVEELPNIHSAILLTNDQTDTLWFQKCARQAKIICFNTGRIGFYTPDKEKTAPTNGQAFQYFGPDAKRFIEVFKEQGLLVRPI